MKIILEKNIQGQIGKNVAITLSKNDIQLICESCDIAAAYLQDVLEKNIDSIPILRGHSDKIIYSEKIDEINQLEKILNDEIKQA